MNSTGEEINHHNVERKKKEEKKKRSEVERSWLEFSWTRLFGNTYYIHLELSLLYHPTILHWRHCPFVRSVSDLCWLEHVFHLVCVVSLTLSTRSLVQKLGDILWSTSIEGATLVARRHQVIPMLMESFPVSYNGGSNIVRERDF